MTGSARNTRPNQWTRWRRLLQANEAALHVEERECRAAERQLAALDRQRQVALERIRRAEELRARRIKEKRCHAAEQARK